MKQPPREIAALSRRRFVTMLAAGSAALLAPPLAGATPARRARRPEFAALAPADRKELLRQRKSTRDTLEVIRRHAMPPGTEMASVFVPLRTRRDNG